MFLTLGLARVHRLEHFFCYMIGNFRPDGCHFVLAFHVRHGCVLVLLLKFVDLFTSCIDDRFLIGWRDHVVDADRHTRTRCIQEAHRLEVVKKENRRLMSKAQMAIAYERLQAFLLQCSIDER